MCGIVGWIAPAGGLDRETLKKMTDRLAHRGPDGAGLWSSLDRRVGLGHRRLSIIDLSSEAAQPMTDALQRAVIAFNGEIYNHRSLRRELERCGAAFTTDHSDTEVLLLGYLQWGIDEVLRRINGMFAFAIVDIRKRQVILARDRVGIKPLYWMRLGTDVLFASEAKAFWEHPESRASLDTENLYHHLAFRCLPSPRTLFQNVSKLGPGQYAEIAIDTADVRLRRYWDPLDRRAHGPPSLAEAQEELDHLLTSSVRYRMEADVPVGILLSGGLDSSLMLRLGTGLVERMSTYTAVFPEHDAYDEAAHARRAAQLSGAVHHEIPIQHEEYIGHLSQVAYYQDEPIAAPVCVPVYLLSREARHTGVPVVLAGEGSDELFFGYQSWLKLLRMTRWNERLPDSPGRLLRRSAARLLRTVSPRFSPYPEFLRRAAEDQPVFWGGGMDFSELDKRRLLSAQFGRQYSIDSTYEAIIKPMWDDFRQRSESEDVAGWMTYLDVRFRLPELMLARLDKMGMAWSVEGRVPMLDHRIIELVFSIPESWRVQDARTEKPLLKQAVQRRVDGDALLRAKQGFRAPVKEWKSSNEWQPYLRALKAFGVRSDLFDPKALDELVMAVGDRLYFSLVNFMLWYCTFIDNIVEDHLGTVAP